jgi:chromosome segregation ATPase
MKVDKWLARVFFPNRVPDFERTEETLSYLHDLSSMSTQRTKEKQALLFAQERTVEEYKQRVKDTDIQLRNVGIEHASLDTKTVELLDELVQVGMVLHVDPSNANVFDIAKGLSDQIDEEQELESRMHEIETLRISLEKDLGDVTVLKGQLQQAQRNQESRQDTLDEKISEWTRGIKLLQAKTEEYESRATNSKVRSCWNTLMVGNSGRYTDK